MNFRTLSALALFLACGEYAATRPISNSLFLEYIGAGFYPYVWLFTLPLNLIAVALYNRFLPKFGAWPIFAALSCFIISVNALTCLFPRELIFFQYAWKDIYILFVLKQIWSLIHTRFDKEKAKSTYGILYGVGTLGATVGSFLPGFLAPLIGSSKLMLITLPIYAALSLVYKESKPVSGAIFSEDKSVSSLIRTTPLLLGILGLVVLMQMSVGLMEYRFNMELGKEIPNLDLRSAYTGKLFGLINALSLLLQFFGTLFFVKVLGTKRTHIFMPILLLIATALSLIYPSFLALSLTYVVFKAVDFSLFNVFREMLYVPLTLDAKYRAKAIIDIFAYRSSKALLSLALLGMLSAFIPYFAVGILGIWLVGACFFFYNKRIESTT